jgi:hypothetical protein
MEDQVTKILNEERKVEEIESLEENKINWIDDDFFNSWGIIKAHMKKLWNHGQEFTSFQDYKDEQKWFFLSHSKDIIKGKPQLIDNVQKRIPLVKTVLKTIKIKGEDPVTEINYSFFDDKYDKRYDGNNIDTFSLDFWMYRVITPEGKEVFVWTDKKLPNQKCTFKGMLVEMDDFAELSNSMKVKSISKIFFLNEFEPDIKILTKEQLVNFTKSRGITEEQWLNFLAYHPFGTYNHFPIQSELLRSAQILSSKVDGYPLHIFYWGPTGTRKSMGIIETTAFKFSEDSLIVEGGNSRIKVLVPSFKEKPANLGYLAKQDRMGWVDELGKMVESEMNKHQSNEMSTNILGELNFLLDNKKRMVGSGNDNECEVEATAKFTFVSNPVNGRSTIYDHVGLIDPTTMSRMLQWVQDDDEQSFVLSEKGIVRSSPHTYTSIDTEKNNIDIGNIEYKRQGLYICWGKYVTTEINRDEFLTLFDTCNSFLCNVDLDKSQIVCDNVTLIAKEPIKSSIWKPRGLHHVTLLIDGLCKHRCLFKDFDPTFEVKDEDYILANEILDRMVKSWDTNLGKKERRFGL